MGAHMEGARVSGQTWTPAPKKGAIPLHPMTFGMLLGRAFSALRHNPKVLFGFAVTVQLVVTVVSVAVLFGIAMLSFTRLASVSPASPDYPTIAIGTGAINIVAGILIALAGVAFTAVVQGVVAADVSYAALGRKASLRMLWARVRPAFWRIWAFALLQLLLVFGGVAIGIGILVVVIVNGAPGSGSGADIAAALGMMMLTVIGVTLLMMPLVVWLSTKLLLVPSILVLEGATLGAALVRSWRLTRGRFWPALGVMFLIGAIMGLAAQVVGVPGSLLTMVLTGIFVPTGETGPTEVITLIALTVLPQILVIAVQAVTLVVQGTGSTLIYLDCRMRYEGLDQTLLGYTERSMMGASDEELGDPYRVDPERAVTSTPPPRPAQPPVPGYGQPPGYPAGYGQPAAYPPGYGQPAAYPPGYGQPDAYPPGYGQPAGYPPGSYPAAPSPAEPAPAGAYPTGSSALPPYATAPPAPPQAGPQVIPPSSRSPWAPPGDDRA